MEQRIDGSDAYKSAKISDLHDFTFDYFLYLRVKGQQREIDFVKSSAVARDDFSDRCDFYLCHGDDVAKLFIDNSFVLCLDLLVSNRFKRVAERFGGNPNCVFKSDKLKQELWPPINT
jgi:hypothetical protein